MKIVSIIFVIVAAIGGCFRTEYTLDPEDSGSGNDPGQTSGPDAASDMDIDADVDTDTESDKEQAGYGSVAKLCWVATFGGENGDVHLTDTIALGDGTLLLIGRFIVEGGNPATLTFDRGLASELTLPTTAEKTLFIAVYDADGNIKWVKILATFNEKDGTEALVHATAHAGDDDFFLLGNFSGTMVLGNGEAQQTTLVSRNENSNLFLARYTKTGDLVWARRDGSGDTHSSAATALPDGSVVIVGHINENLVLGEGEPGATELERAEHGSTLFLARYAADGALIWARTELARTISSGPAVTATASGDFLLTGSLSGSVTLGYGQPSETTFHHPGIYLEGLFAEPTIFMFASYDNAGGLEWATAAYSNFNHMYARTALVANGDYIVSGHFQGDITFRYGDEKETHLEAPVETDDSLNTVYSPALYIARFNQLGEVIWINSSSNSAGSGVKFTNAILLPNGDIGVSGTLWGQIDFGAGAPEDIRLISEGESEPYVGVYRGDGTLRWVARLGSGWSNKGEAQSLVGFEDGTFAVAGEFDGAFSVNNNGSSEQLTSWGNRDGFLMRVCAESIDSDEQTAHGLVAYPQ